MSTPEPGPLPGKRPAFEPPRRLLSPTGYDPDMRRPTSTVAGVVLVLLRVVAGILILMALIANWDTIAQDLGVWDGSDSLGPDARAAILWGVVAIGGAILALDALLAVLIYRGLNWPRVLVMLIAVISISTVFIAWWVQDQEFTIEGVFVSLSLDILILLALSSRAAAAYARRNERRPPFGTD